MALGSFDLILRLFPRLLLPPVLLLPRSLLPALLLKAAAACLLSVDDQAQWNFNLPACAAQVVPLMQIQ